MTEFMRMKSQKRNMKSLGMMRWNGMRVLEWNWIGVSVIVAGERKNGMGMDENE